MNDPIGKGIADYFENKIAEDIIVNTNYTEGERLAPQYFFRNEREITEIEKTALNLCRGKVLDIGAAAGCHALILQNRGLEVVAVEKSLLASKVMKKRGVKNVVCQNIEDFFENNFDTVIVLMNGTGIGKTLKGLKVLLKNLKKMMNSKGQILIDSTDISYLFQENDGSVWVDLNNDKYIGEMEYELNYKDQFVTFKWLFVDFKTLENIAKDVGLKCELIKNGDHSDYLARLRNN